MCMWQSQAPSGALNFGGSVPAEFDTCWPWLCRPIADAVPAIAIIEALLMKVRRAIILISLARKPADGRLTGRHSFRAAQRMGHPAPDRQDCRSQARGIRISFPHQEESMKIRVKLLWTFLRNTLGIATDLFAVLLACRLSTLLTMLGFVFFVLVGQGREFVEALGSETQDPLYWPHQLFFLAAVLIWFGTTWLTSVAPPRRRRSSFRSRGSRARCSSCSERAGCSSPCSSSLRSGCRKGSAPSRSCCSPGRLGWCSATS